jgi:hypothetical protein
MGSGGRGSTRKGLRILRGYRVADRISREDHAQPLWKQYGASKCADLGFAEPAKTIPCQSRQDRSVATGTRIFPWKPVDDGSFLFNARLNNEESLIERFSKKAETYGKGMTTKQSLAQMEAESYQDSSENR